MKNEIKYVITFFVCISCLSGCFLPAKMMAPNNLYIEGYELNSSKIKQAGVHKLARNLANEIQKELNAELLGSTGGIIVMRVNAGKDCIVNISVSYWDNARNTEQQSLRVTIRKAGPEMTNELMQVKKKLENVFRKHGFTWKSEVSHSTWN